MPSLSRVLVLLGSAALDCLSDSVAIPLCMHGYTCANATLVQTVAQCDPCTPTSGEHTLAYVQTLVQTCWISDKPLMNIATCRLLLTA